MVIEIKFFVLVWVKYGISVLLLLKIVSVGDVVLKFLNLLMLLLVFFKV